MLSRSLAERHERLQDDRLRDETDDLIPHPAADRIVNGSHSRIAPRERYHHARAWDPDALISTQRGFDAGAILSVVQRRAEDDGVFERLRSALAGVRQHRMRSIAQQRDRPLTPRTDSIAFE